MNGWMKWGLALVAVSLVGCQGISDQWSAFEQGMALADAENRTDEKRPNYIAQAPAEMPGNTVQKATELAKLCCEKVGGTWAESAVCGFSVEEPDQDTALATCMDLGESPAPKAG